MRKSTDSWLFSDACLRQEVIPLNTRPACIPFKLEASAVKSDRDAPRRRPTGLRERTPLRGKTEV